MTTQIDVHQDVLQWFDDNVSPIDNRTYWSVDYDFVNKPSGVYPDPAFPCYPGHPCPTSTQGCACGGPCAPWPSYREVEYAQGLLINDTEQGVYNCALRAVRLHMREDYDEAVPACQFAGPMTNVLLSNFAITGQPLALRNDNPGLPSNFVPQFMTIRDSSFLAIGFENYYAASDPPNAQTQCCGTLNGTVPPQYTIGQILASNNHYVFMCGGTTCSAVTPWTAMGFCVPPNGSGPAQPSGNQLAVYAAPGLNTGGDCTWGYGELLDDDGHPLILFNTKSSPLLQRTKVVRLKYYLDGEPVDKCGSTNGADPIGPLGDN